MRSGLGTIIWLLVGLVIAGQHHYYTHAHTVRLVVSAALAVLLWPLVLLGVNLHLH